MFILKKSIYIILIISTACSCGKMKNNKEIEPNNTISSATEIELNIDFTGLLDSDNDIDNFLLKIDEDQIIRLELSGVKGVNHAIEVWKLTSANPQLLKVIDDNRKSSPEEMANLSVSSGNYIIIIKHGSRDVRKGNSENRYTLKVTSRSPFSEEREPNDSAETSNQINNGDSIAGYYSPSQNRLNENQQSAYREEDWFRTDIISGEENPVTIDLLLKGVSGVDSTLTLFGPDMKELFTSDNTSAGGAESITGFGLKTSGTYYILATSKSFQYNHREPYELSLKLNTHDSGSELESNNNFESANKITGNQISGKINNAGDQDFFYYSGLNETNVRIRLQNSPGLDSSVTVYSSDRTKLLEASNSGAGDEEIIPAVYIKDAIYLRINSTQNSLSDMSYILTIEPVQTDGEMETEPNNSLKEANLLTRSISGFTSYKNDKDYFLIKSAERGKYKITAESPKNGSIRLSTTDQMGYIIKTKTISNGESVSFPEMFDRKGYVLVETSVPDMVNMYRITIEESR